MVDKLDDDVYSIGNASMIYDPIELTLKDITHLIKGEALIDLSDGEYINVFKLSNKAKTELLKLSSR